MPSSVNWLTFTLHVISRCFEIMPRRSKRIKMRYLEYAGSTTLESERIIKFRFTNALWYKVGSLKTLATRIPVSGTEGSEITITVHGFFRKSIYSVELMHDYVQVLRVA
ncbi:hypothetical protein [Flavobacterium psychrotrophum]|uniref:hypothetical protein n=1 Tax=Flavobacterium psychrotrophum TaxID=2294119 RepID=UPI0013C5148D|nr:hypothetical protein [Flavobacterium psychrotrophum]